MWFEILPSAAIITAALSLPTFALYGLNKLVLGNGYRRNMDERFSRAMYTRDSRLTVNPYIQNEYRSRKGIYLGNPLYVMINEFNPG